MHREGDGGGLDRHHLSKIYHGDRPEVCGAFELRRRQELEDADDRNEAQEQHHGARAAIVQQEFSEEPEQEDQDRDQDREQAVDGEHHRHLLARDLRLPDDVVVQADRLEDVQQADDGRGDGKYSHFIRRQQPGNRNRTKELHDEQQKLGPSHPGQVSAN